MTSKIKVIDNSYTYQTVSGETDNDSPYCYRGETNTEHDIQGIKKTSGSEYFDLEVPFDVEFGKSYFLVYVIYSTGDSFGNDYGRIEFIDLFQKEKLANSLKKKIEQHYNEYVESNLYSYVGGRTVKRAKAPHHTIKYTNNEGKEIDLYTGPWIGYFERLQDVYCELVLCK